MLLDCLPPRPGARLRLAGLAGSSDALALAELAQLARPLVVFCHHAREAQRLTAELGWLAPDLRIRLLPDWETLPYDTFSPHQDLVSERLETLYQISQGACDVLLCPVTTALQRLPPREYLAARTFFLARKQHIDLAALRAQLTLAGYNHVNQVVSPGEYSVRGGLLDLFPMGSTLPYRIDLFDNEIDSLRTFDVDTQRSIYPVNEIRLLPGREFPLDEAGRSRFRQAFREQFEGDPSKSRVYRDISAGLAPPGIEYYLPLFFEQTATLFEYLPAGSTLCLHHAPETAASQFWRDTRSRFELLRGDRDQPLLPPEALFLEVEDFFSRINTLPRIDLATGDGGEITQSPPAVQIDRRHEQPLSALRDFLSGTPHRTLIAAESAGRRETLAQLFAGQGIAVTLCESFADFCQSDARVMLAAAPLETGFAAPEAGFTLLTEAELYAQQVRQQRRRDARRSSPEGMLRDLTELRVGDPVVHEQHGVGRYCGLVNLDLGEGETEFLHLSYQGGDALYVPVSALHLIGRYSGGPLDSAPLHRLGSGQWEKVRKRALQQARDTAAELLNLYAQRAARPGRSHPLRETEYAAFCAGFPFEETPDQAAAIQAVCDDLQSERPMDRLVCGDVGFGKTEVALRAAFVALMNGCQVALLVPTTLLAEQHFQNFSDRLSDWPVRIAELSRFRSAKEQADALQGLTDGRIDLIIGTHRLLQKDVRFKNLGLVIIDEEHRFGVRQKEQLKRLRAEVDVLTLTATPIPRTLALSLEGLRDFSVIATAPQRRLAIKTFVAQHGPGIIREAVLRELKRGGQVYFLHNEVETIHAQRERLTALLPEARIEVAHGQMRERELEQVMRDFYQQRFNVLLCTTIIETGIDVPSANTILMARADHFGLAQLHQLRGRVGRSHHQAYAYLLVDSLDGLTAQAKKRLEAIQTMEELGSGFYLAMHDLEIRGAGEVLGESQSGDMQEVGFQLYADMLNAAVRSLREGREPELDAPLSVATEINLHCPALLPDDYCPDVHERLVLYKRMAHCSGEDGLEPLTEELIDRFGPLPDQARALVESHRLRVLCRPLGIVKLDAGSEQVLLQFEANPPIDPLQVMQLIRANPRLTLSGPDRLRLVTRLPDIPARVAAVRQLLRELSP